MIIFHIISKVISYKVLTSSSESENLIYDRNTAMKGQTKNSCRQAALCEIWISYAMYAYCYILRMCFFLLDSVTGLTVIKLITATAMIKYRWIQTYCQ